MKRISKRLLLISTLAMLVGAALVAFSTTPALAEAVVATQDEEGARPLNPGMRVSRMCPGGMQAAADMLGMTEEELNTQLWAGSSLEQLAEAKGVDFDALEEAVQAACEVAREERQKPAYIFGRMRYSEKGFEVLADELGMSVDDLNTALEEGQTLADLAEAADVDLQELMTRYQEVNQEAMKDSILQAIEDGGLDQDHGDWLLEGLEKGFMGAKRGIGRMGKMGMGKGW